LGFGGILWFNSATLAFSVICLATIWKSSSFVALVLFAGLQAIPHEFYEAAEVDGAGAIRKFISVTLPLLAPSICISLVFRTIGALQTFDIPFIMTRGGPGESTVTLGMYIHQNTLEFLDLGYGSTLGLVMFVLSIGATVLYLRQIQATA